MTKRECGTCRLCCKLLAIPTISKPAGYDCPHWTKKTRCSIYDTRPVECRRFACGWLVDGLPMELSPHRTRIVVWMDSKDEIETIYLAEESRGTARYYFKDLISRWESASYKVIIVVKGKIDPH